MTDVGILSNRWWPCFRYQQIIQSECSIAQNTNEATEGKEEPFDLARKTNNGRPSDWPEAEEKSDRRHKTNGL